MTHPLGGLVAVVLAVTTLGACSPDKEDVSDPSKVSVADPALLKCISRTLGLSAEEPLTQTNMETLHELKCSKADVVSLSGLEAATNLTELDLTSNEIVEVSPLAGLTNLIGLALGDNPVTDVSSLAGLDAEILVD